MRGEDVIIVGAGAAGLAAAAELGRAGLSVRVLEARQRTGGRILTFLDGRNGFPLELGAEFIHGRPPETWGLIRETGLAAYEIPDTHFMWERSRGHGRLRENTDFWERIERVFSRMRKRGRPRSFLEFLEAERRRFPEGDLDRKLALAFVEGYEAADPARISEQSLARGEAETDEIDGYRIFRARDGQRSIIAALERKCFSSGNVDLQLNRAVSTIRWAPGRAEVMCEDASGELHVYAASRVIVTIPVSCLKRIRFQPGLPSKERALSGIAMGSVVKVLLKFDQPFWESTDAGRKVSLLVAPGEPIPTWWTSLPFHLPYLIGWSGGPRALALSRLEARELMDIALATVARVFGKPKGRVERRLTDWAYHDWQADPYSAGAYSYLVAGGEDASDELARPAKSTLFFAGEATESHGINGTVEAALASGKRVAREVLRGGAALRTPGSLRQSRVRCSTRRLAS